MPARIAIVTDIHYGPDTGRVRGPQALTQLERALGHAAAAQPDVLIDLGDRLTDQNPDADRDNLTALAARFRTFPTRRLHLRGNHDLLDADEQARVLDAPLGNRSVEIGGWHIVLLETYNGTTGGAVTSDDAAWLERTLASSDLPAVLFTHQPLHGQPMKGNPYFETIYAAHACPQGAHLARDVVERSGRVHACISGHAHWNDLRVVNDIPYLTVQSMSESWPTGGEPSGAWTELELDGSVRARVHGLDPLDVELNAAARER